MPAGVVFVSFWLILKAFSTKLRVNRLINPLSANLTKWPNTLKQFDEFFECVLQCCGVAA